MKKPYDLSEDDSFKNTIHYYIYILIHIVQTNINEGSCIIHIVQTNINEGSCLIHIVQTNINEGSCLIHIVWTNINEGSCIIHIVQTNINEGSCLINVICVCLLIVVSNTYCGVCLYCFSPSSVKNFG